MTSSTLGARQLRYKAFQEFLSSATESFKSLCNNNPEANRFKAIYSLCTCPGGRQGGKNARQLEVFFGARPFDSQENFDSTARPSLKLLSERGATLEFVRDDLGRVHVFLYPAVSEGMKPIEDAIELKIVGDPADLAKGTVLSRHFRWLVWRICSALAWKAPQPFEIESPLQSFDFSTGEVSMVECGIPEFQSRRERSLNGYSLWVSVAPYWLRSSGQPLHIDPWP